MPKVDFIKARFGGKDVTFRIERRDLEAFERYADARAMPLLLALLEKGWGATDVARVLRFATLDASTLSMTRRTGDVHLHAKQTFVDRVLASRPVADYVPLAAAILTAALFGVDEAEATFSDEADATN